MSELLLSISGDLRGETALAYLPSRGHSPSERLFMADGLTGIDAWGAVAVRIAIEFYARYQSRQVTVSPPRRAEASRLFYHLLCEAAPRHACLSDDADTPTGEAPRTIVLPAQRVISVERADEIAAALIGTASGRLARATRFLASQLPELVLNSLVHGADSPTAPVACIFHDREEEQLQLVVGDLGSRYDRVADADQALLRALNERGDDGALSSAVDVAASRGIDASLTLAGGAGRVYWRRGTWSTTQDIAVPGFVTAIAVQLA